MTEIQKSILRGIPLLLLMIGGCLYITVMNKDKQRDEDYKLKKNKKHAIAKIINTYQYYSKGKYCRLSFTFKNKNIIHTLEERITPLCDCDFYKNKECVVIFDSINFNIFQLILTSDKYSEYGLSKIDNLSWIDSCK